MSDSNAVSSSPRTTLPSFKPLATDSVVTPCPGTRDRNWQQLESVARLGWNNCTGTAESYWGASCPEQSCFTALAQLLEAKSQDGSVSLAVRYVRLLISAIPHCLLSATPPLDYRLRLLPVMFREHQWNLLSYLRFAICEQPLILQRGLLGSVSRTHDGDFNLYAQY